MKTILSILLGSVILIGISTTQTSASTNVLVRPCILVNGLNPTTGDPDYTYKCTTTSVQLSVRNCGTAGNSIDPNLFTYSWVNLSSGSFTYTTPTINTSEAGRWVVTISYTDISSIVYTEKDTLDLINYTSTPISINNGTITGHCPYDVVNFTATSNPQIVSNSYKWYLNPTNTIDTTGTITSSGLASWTTTILTNKYVVVSATDNNGCKILANIYSPLLLTPIAPNIGATHIKCPGTNIILTATAQAGNTYSWDGGPYTATNTFSTAVPGKHWVTVQRGLGCKLADTTYISEYTLSTVNIGSDTSLCYMESGQLSAKVTGTPSYTYAWSPAPYFNNPAIANPIITIVPISTVNITLTVTDGNTCTSTASKNVTHLAQGSNPYLNISAADLNICEGTTQYFNTNVSATYPTTYSYQWTPTTYLSNPNIQKPVVDLNGTGTTNIAYSLKVTDYKGCYTIITPNASLVPALTASVGFSDTSVCDNNIITLQSSHTGGTAPITYTWSPSSGLDDASIPNPSATVTQNKLYTITISDTYGCSDYKTVNIKDSFVKVVFVAKDTIGYKDEGLLLNPLLNSLSYTYVWSIDDIIDATTSRTIITSKEIGVYKYKITATDPVSQCFASDSINVIIKENIPRTIYIPNVFNPNSSNSDENKVVKVYAASTAIKENDFAFKIYNKWGQLIYETTSFAEANNKGWSGAYQGNGVDQNQSVYTYTLQGKYFDGEDFNKTGSITLLK